MEYEEMIKRLEEIVEKLESGECGFDDATKLFEEGKNLAVECSKKLDSNKGKITVLESELEKLVEKDFENINKK